LNGLRNHLFYYIRGEKGTLGTSLILIWLVNMAIGHLHTYIVQQSIGTYINASLHKTIWHTYIPCITFGKEFALQSKQLDQKFSLCTRVYTSILWKLVKQEKILLAASRWHQHFCVYGRKIPQSTTDWCWAGFLP
jgi:hypothetical protein